MVFDLMVIGGGPGGYLAAERAQGAGLKTVLFEKNKLGGVCLNEGCIPSKTLLNSAKIFEHAKDGKAFGVTAENPQIDQARVIKRKNKVVKTLVSGIGMTMKNLGVEVVSDHANILGKEGDTFRVEAGDTVYEGRTLMIATGSVPVVPPITGVKEGLEAGMVMTNREVLELSEIPERLVVIGGGVIGLEMAGYYQAVGSEVVVVEMLDHIAGNVDSEIGSLLQKSFEKKGVKFFLKAKVTEVGKDFVKYEKDGETFTIGADKVLLSVGRRAVTQGFGLENLGVATERGHIVTNPKQQTNVENVYAVGDVNGQWMLAHAAYREAEVAVNNILGQDEAVCYANCPSVIYTHPEVAWVGATAKEMEQTKRPYREVSIPFNYAGRYVAEIERELSLCKLILDTKTNTLAGCHLMGSYASEMIIAAGIMIEQQMPLEQMKAQVYPHPTVSEVIREAIFKL